MKLRGLSQDDSGAPKRMVASLVKREKKTSKLEMAEDGESLKATVERQREQLNRSEMADRDDHQSVRGTQYNQHHTQ